MAGSQNFLGGLEQMFKSTIEEREAEVDSEGLINVSEGEDAFVQYRAKKASCETGGSRAVNPLIHALKIGGFERTRAEALKIATVRNQVTPAYHQIHLHSHIFPRLIHCASEVWMIFQCVDLSASILLHSAISRHNVSF